MTEPDEQAAAHRAIGTAQRSLGLWAEAESSFERGLRIARDAFGPGSLEVAELENDLGMTFKFAGRFDDAEAAYERVHSIFEALPTVDPSDLAALYHNLGGLAHARGDHVTAEPLARHAVELRSAAVGPIDVATLLDRSAHAAVLDGLGRSAEAEAEIREILPGLAAALGDGHPEVAVARGNLAAIIQRRGDLGEAERLYRQVLASREAVAGPDSPTLAIPLNNLGTVLRAAGRPGEARLAYERALEILHSAVAEDHPTVRSIRRNLARIGAPSPLARAAVPAPEDADGGATDGPYSAGTEREPGT